MFSDIWNKIKEIIRKMLPKKTVEDVLHVTPCVSDRMADAIQLWSDMYEGNSPWVKEPTYEDPTRIVSLGLPALIASEKARMVVLEMKSEISAPMQDVEVGSVPTTNDMGEAGNPGPADVPVPTPENNPADTGPIPNSITPSSAFAQKTESVPTGPTERADFLNKQYKKVMKQIRRQLEYGIAKGGLVIKPYIVLYEKKSNNDEQNTPGTLSGATGNDFSKKQDKNTVNNKDAKNEAQSTNTKPSTSRLTYTGKEVDSAEIEFDFIQADRFFPMSFDANGKVVEAAFIQTKVDKALERVYIRLEYHKLEKHTVTVQNMAFESTDMSLANSNNIKSASNLGKQIPLKEVSEWASLQPVTVIEDVDHLLFAYFKMPEANTVDPYSPLGVSGFSRVIQLIKDADMQYSRILWEFEGGEMAIDVDRDALVYMEGTDGRGKSMLPQKQNRLFRKIDLNMEDTYNVFAPNLRDASLINGLNTIFMRIEDNCGLSRGTLSDVTTQEAKTATELKILKQRSYAANADIQAALQEALEDLIYVMDVYCTLYDVTPPGEYEASFEWDDSIIVDSESELSKRITLQQNGLASKLENRMWYFGETENQARMALRQIDEEATQAVMQNVQADVMRSTALGTNMDNSDTVNSGDEDTKSPSDTTDKKITKGKQADSLDNPNKSKSAENLKSGKK